MVSKRRGPRNAEDRLRRLLVMLPWLMEQGEVAIDEVASRFSMSTSDVVKDLELVSMCGLPPFVDELIDVFIDEGMVYVGVPRLFTRPLNLNSVEAVELLAAARTAMQLPGADVDGPLGRGLRKLAEAIGEDETGVLSVDLARPKFLDEVADAIERAERLKITYWSASSDTTSERTIVPRQVYTDRGAWYVTADDDRSGELRTFRIDRIESLETTGDTGVASEVALPEPGAWFADGSVPRVTVSFPADRRGVIERFPVDEISEPGESGDDDSGDEDLRVTATLAVVNERWLATLLLRLGPSAEVVEPEDWKTLGADTATSILAIYQP